MGAPEEVFGGEGGINGGKGEEGGVGGDEVGGTGAFEFLGGHFGGDGGGKSDYGVMKGKRVIMYYYGGLSVDIAFPRAKVLGLTNTLATGVR